MTAEQRAVWGDPEADALFAAHAPLLLSSWAASLAAQKTKRTASTWILEVAEYSPPAVKAAIPALDPASPSFSKDATRTLAKALLHAAKRAGKITWNEAEGVAAVHA